MKTFCILFVVLLASLVVADKTWTSYKLNHGKDYDHPQVDRLRKELYLKQDAMIQLHNSQPHHTWKMVHNMFSDMTEEEKKAFYGLIQPTERTSEKLETETDVVESPIIDRTNLPASVDYRKDPCMPPVKNQKQCGSCWAFASLNTLEFSNCKKYNKLSVLSEQQLVDCAYPRSGCSGGWPSVALKYLYGGVALDSTIPYTAKYGNCTFQPSMKAAAVASYQDMTKSKNKDMVLAMQSALVQNSTIAVAIHVAKDFSAYGSGIYTPTAGCSESVNHGVVVVGYGTEKGIDYWIVRNSWGAKWGSKGYILMRRGENQCHIENFPFYTIAA